MCVEVNGQKYDTTRKNVCSKCLNPFVNIVRIAMFAILLLLYLSLLILANVVKKTENQTSVVLRILTNYLQVTSATFSFNLGFPNILVSMVAPISNAKSSFDSTLLSFDCMTSDMNFGKLADDSKVPMKALFSLLGPFALIIGIFIFWTVLTCALRASRNFLKRTFTVSVITLLLLLHPTLTESAFSLYLCINLDDAGTRLERDLNVSCWTPSHTFWSLSIGIPIIVVWVIGSPVFGFILLFLRRKNLYSKK